MGRYSDSIFTIILVSFSTFILYNETFLDYNFLCLLLLLVIEYLELIKHNDGKKLDLIIGILGGLGLTYLYYFVIIFIYNLIK